MNKNYRVTMQKYKIADIITSVLHISLGGNFQKESQYKPINWSLPTSSVVQKQMEDIIEKSDIVFRRCRYNYLTLMIDAYMKKKDEVSERIQTLLLSKQRMCVNQVNFI